VGYAAYRYPVLGALMLSGPQDLCGEEGAARLPVGRSHIYGCYAVDEPGAEAIRSNLAVFTEVRTINTTGRPRNHEQCFSMMRNVLDIKPPGKCVMIPRSAFVGFQRKGIFPKRC